MSDIAEHNTRHHQPERRRGSVGVIVIAWAFLCETGCYKTFAGDGSFVRGVCCCKRWLQAGRAMHVLTACFRCKCYARPFGRTD